MSFGLKQHLLQWLEDHYCGIREDPYNAVNDIPNLKHKSQVLNSNLLRSSRAIQGLEFHKEHIQSEILRVLVTTLLGCCLQLSMVALAGEDLLLIFYIRYNKANAGHFRIVLAYLVNSHKYLVFDTFQKIGLKEDSLEGMSTGIARPNDPCGGHKDTQTLDLYIIIICCSPSVEVLEGIYIALVIFVARL